MGAGSLHEGLVQLRAGDCQAHHAGGEGCGSSCARAWLRAIRSWEVRTRLSSFSPSPTLLIPYHSLRVVVPLSFLFRRELHPFSLLLSSLLPAVTSFPPVSSLLSLILFLLPTCVTLAAPRLPDSACHISALERMGCRVISLDFSPIAVLQAARTRRSG